MSDAVRHAMNRFWATLRGVEMGRQAERDRIAAALVAEGHHEYETPPTETKTMTTAANFPHLDAAMINDLRDQSEGDHEFFVEMCQSTNDRRARQAKRRADIAEWNRTGMRQFWSESVSSSVAADYATGNVRTVMAD